MLGTVCVSLSEVVVSSDKCGSDIIIKNNMDKLVIAGKEFSSRLFLGTGKFGRNTDMEAAIKASGTQMVTFAMKRIDLTATMTTC